MVERRIDKRVPCRECRGDQLYSDMDVRAPVIYYLNISAHGAGCFHVGDPLPLGTVFYVLRHGFQKVFYKVCWSLFSGDSTYHTGLQVLDAGRSCTDLLPQNKSMKKVKYESRMRKTVELGLF